MTELRRSLHHAAVRRERKYRLRGLVKRASLAALAGVCRAVIRLIGSWDPDRTARAGGRLMRAIGPWLRGHRVARGNLKAAFPEKSDWEIERVIDGVWDNLGRVLAELAFLDRLSDYDPRKPSNKWILIDQATIERGFEIAKRGGPYLVFGAHLANWELPPSIPAAFGIPFTGVYYPSGYGAADDLLIKIRSRRAKLIAARFGAAQQIENALGQGSSIGMMADLRFGGGAEVVFFGRKCTVNPALARFARKYEYPLYGARAIRVPGGRFRLELTQPLNPPRDAEGKIDVAATMQMITWIIEGWVREHPEQWLWVHRRWL
jgi:Kdo2-lipid IVA lauroyltransferase/acyltransferase